MALPHFTGKIVAAVVAVAAGVSVWANLAQISESLNGIYAPVSTCSVLPEDPAADCVVTLNVGFLLITTVLFAVVLYVIGYILFEIFCRPDRRLNKQVKRLRANKDRLVARIHSVINKLYGDADVRRFNFTDIEEKYEINAHGDLKASCKYVLQGGTEPTQFWQRSFYADDSSPALESFEALGFQAKLINPQPNESVEHLELVDRDRSKAVAVFFLPEIAPGQQRTLQVEYTWPRYQQDLISKDRSDHEISFTSQDPNATCNVKLAFSFARGLGDVVIADVTGRPSSANWTCQKSDQWTEWTLISSTYPLGGKQYKFEISRRVS